MFKAVAAGLLAGAVAFVLFTVSDVVFFRRYGDFPAAQRFESERRRLLIVFSIALVHAAVIGLLFGLFYEGIPADSPVEKGVLFGLAAGLILSRQSVEAVFLFDQAYVPSRYAYYWLVEYLGGYTVLGAILGWIYGVL